MQIFLPHDWYWLIGGDETRAWSSAIGGYVTNWPPDRVTRIASEAELVDVLAVYGIDGPLTLDAAKAKYKAKLDADAEAVRLRVITPGAGMALVYAEKFAQAGAVQAMGEQAANAMSQADRESNFPTLSASIGIEGATLWDCAQLVLEKYAQFAALSLLIERGRLMGKKAIAAATDVDGVRAAYGAVVWPTP